MIGLIVFLTIVLSADSMVANIKGKNQQCSGICCILSCPSGSQTGTTSGNSQIEQEQGNCQQTGCPTGSCCSKYGYCGNTPEHCDQTPISNGNCKTQGCPPGQCCSDHGFCGTTSAHCKDGTGVPFVQGDCQQKGCPRGLCCSRFGYCGSTAAYCSGTSGSVPSGSSTSGSSIDCSSCVGSIVINCPKPCREQKIKSMFFKQ